MQARGNFIGGAFVPSSGKALISRNPAADGAVVLETAGSPAAVDEACAAAAAAQPGWAALTPAQRLAHLERFTQEISARAQPIADAIVLETGKIRSEAKAEVATVAGRLELVKAAMAADLRPGQVAPGEHLRFQALGVVGVIGPFNFPVHLCHAHVVPALLAGNTVVVKPSDITPLCGQRYAEAAHAAGLPAGVFNLVAGAGDVGAALAGQRALRGLCFTGSWTVGRRILEAAVDRPELLIALEMGGKNTCIVLDDAALRQAVHEVAVGGYLSAGQRCTGTERVLVHRKIADRFLDALARCANELPFGSPEDPAMFAGPLATAAALAKVEAALEAARRGGAQPIVPGRRLPGGSYRTASLHRLPDGVHHVPGYTDVELFGPDLCVSVIDSDDEAIAVLEASPYGFANAVFTGSAARFEHVFARTRSGILNRNRSTNLASSKLPFGGVGKSGNYRPAGAWAHRNVTVPVAVLENPIGPVTPNPHLARLLPPFDLDLLERQHAAEEAAEAGRHLLDLPRPMHLARPAGGRLPQSEALLARLYAGDRVPKEKKPPVIDHLRSAGPWMVSIDTQPLAVLDGMSQTATVVGGFAEDPVVRAYVEGEFAETLVENGDTALGETWAAAAFASTLRQLVPGLPHVTFVASGAEANEKAMALCRINCPRKDATRVLAFEGSFHGRTLLALHATHSPSKRAPFELPGYQVRFAPYPLWPEPGEEPAAPSGFYAACATGALDELRERFGDAKDDALLAAEVASLAAVHEALSSGEYFCTIIEPMQSEGGDRYATERFFRGLRLLTRYHQTFLVFDEVQVGFGLGGPFAWHSKFRLLNQRGQPDYPDAVTFAKRAQVGVVMSRFADPEPASAHNASLVRGRIHADMVSTPHTAERLEKLVQPRLAQLAR
ncbi:MAG TPA: aldehyde dehydrogenase family protein, partial [Kofleriaceae bacterium]|nr:aldehyde dehydrogenase family protein [Kofleriaceae bacterium]